MSNPFQSQSQSCPDKDRDGTHGLLPVIREQPRDILQFGAGLSLQQ